MVCKDNFALLAIMGYKKSEKRKKLNRGLKNQEK
jgi:hypothetical protein